MKTELEYMQMRHSVKRRTDSSRLDISLMDESKDKNALRNSLNDSKISSSRKDRKEREKDRDKDKDNNIKHFINDLKEMNATTDDILQRLNELKK